MAKRPNYQVFTEVLGLDEEMDNPLEAFVQAAMGNSTLLNQISSNGPMTWVSIALKAVFSSITLIMALLLIVLCLFFSRQQSKRLAKELDAANEEASNEHHDKVKLLRYAGVSLD